MIRGFRKARIAVAAIVLVMAAFIAVVWIFNRSVWYWPCVATLAAIALGYSMANSVGKLVANTENTKAINILHESLDPEAFISAYEAVARHMRKGTKDRALCMAYLADGYAMKGDFEQAEAILNEGFKGIDRNDAMLTSFYENELCTYCLAAGDITRAAESNRKLHEIRDGCRKTNPELVKNLAGSIEMLDAELAVEDGEAIDSGYWEKKAKDTTYRLHRLSIEKMLAKYAIRMGDAMLKDRMLTRLERDAGKTYLAEWAKNARKQK